jgi:hypothetical protein
LYTHVLEVLRLGGVSPSVNPIVRFDWMVCWCFHSDAEILERWKDLVESGVAFEGPLLKLKSKARMLGSWNKRFFVLDYDKREFLYFSSQSQAHHPGGVPSGSVKFEELIAARSTGANLFQVGRVLGRVEVGCLSAVFLSRAGGIR